MEEVIQIEGGHLLNGEVKISGAKNATVALMPAAILGNGTITIHGVPNIADVKSLETLLQELGVKVSKSQYDSFILDTTDMHNAVLDHKAVSKLRASYYFMGSLLGKYGYCKIKMPGGCYLGPRPIDIHLDGFKALGANVEYEQGYYTISASQLIGAKIYLNFASVGATINIMMAAVHAIGRTIIENAAKEPEIIDVANMLNKMGAQIRGMGTSSITIEGVDRTAMHGCIHEIIPDRIEAGTYIILAAAVGQCMKITNIIPTHLEALLSKLEEMGVNIDPDIDSITIRRTEKFLPVDIKTLVYPGLATDLQQPLTTLLTQADGTSTIIDTIYPERFKHCLELARMGANIEVSNGKATIVGPTKLFGESVTATDLRCGASLIIAGLMADGVTTIHGVDHIYRGYEKIIEKLSNCGAVIKKSFTD